ncbi:MAG: polysaccharide deacetylase family protein [Candidatus Saccharibacteria bacterium]
MSKRGTYIAYIVLGISIFILGLTSQALATAPVAQISSVTSGHSESSDKAILSKMETPFAHSPHDILTNTVQASIASIAEDLRPIDCAIDACVALTFDDGPDRIHTPALLDVLKKHKAHASFFLIGNKIAGREEIVRRIAAEGHDIGNHSWAHPNMTKLTTGQIDAEFNQTQVAIANTGVPAPRMFRPPYGKQNALVASRIPVPRILWNVDPHDWASHTPEQITADVLKNVRNGSIVVMHDTYDITGESRAIEELSKSYKLVTVSKLLSIKPGDRNQYFSR